MTMHAQSMLAGQINQLIVLLYKDVELASAWWQKPGAVYCSSVMGPNIRLPAVFLIGAVQSVSVASLTPSLKIQSNPVFHNSSMLSLTTRPMLLYDEDQLGCTLYAGISNSHTRTTKDQQLSPAR